MIVGVETKSVNLHNVYERREIKLDFIYFFQDFTLVK